MRFLHGSALTKEIQQMVKTRSDIKIAVAYWGKNALKLTKLSTRRKDIRLICCLKGGKSDPEIVEKFGNRIRQHDTLHAKVIWTSDRAVVSSANMSSNGLPLEEENLKGLVEAGVVRTDPDELSKIKRWFDEKYRSARLITKGDLEKAKEARPLGGWGQRPVKRSLIDALRNGGPQEFKQQRIAFALWKNPMSQAQQKGVRKLLKDDSPKVEQALNLSRRDLSRLDQYGEWDDIPANTFLIDCHYRRGVITNIYVTKTFDVNKRWRIDADGEETWVHFALKSGAQGFNYKLSPADKKAIRKASRELWSKLGRKRKDEAGVLPLLDVAPILLRHAV